MEKKIRKQIHKILWFGGVILWAFCYRLISDPFLESVFQEKVLMGKIVSCFLVAMGCFWISRILTHVIQILLGWCCGYHLIEWFLGMYVLRKRNHGFRLEKLEKKQYQVVMVPPEREGEKYPCLSLRVANYLVALLFSVGLIAAGWSLSAGWLHIILVSWGIMWMELSVLGMILIVLGPQMEFELGRTVEGRKGIRVFGQVAESLNYGVDFGKMPEHWFDWRVEQGIFDFRTEWMACYRLQFLRMSERYQEAEDVAEFMAKCGKVKNPVIRFQAGVTLFYLAMLLHENKNDAIQVFEREKEGLLRNRDADVYCLLYFYYHYIVMEEKLANECRILYKTALSEGITNGISEEAVFRKHLREKFGGDI